MDPAQGGDDGGTAMLRAACEAAGFTPQFRFRDVDVGSMAGFVAAGLAVALVTPTWQPADGVTVVALADHVTDSYRVLRWRSTNVATAEVDTLHRCHHELYGAVVQRHIATLPWLANNPDAPTHHRLRWRATPLLGKMHERGSDKITMSQPRAARAGSLVTRNEPATISSRPSPIVVVRRCRRRTSSHFRASRG